MKNFPRSFHGSDSQETADSSTELAGEINAGMPQYVIERLSEALNDLGKPIKGSRILLLRLAYKPDVGDARESPSFRLLELL